MYGFSGFQNAALLGDAVLAHGPILVGQAGLLGLREDFGEIVGEAETRVTAGRGLAQQPRILGAEVDASRRRAPAGGASRCHRRHRTAIETARC